MIDEKKDLNNEISLLDIWNIIIRHIFLISIITFVVFLLSSFMFSL